VSFRFAMIRLRDPRAGLVLVGLPQISQSRIIPGILKPPIGYLSDRGNASIRDTAARYHAGFVDLFALSVAHGEERLADRPRRDPPERI